jgi:hypothetical protein
MDEKGRNVLLDFLINLYHVLLYDILIINTSSNQGRPNWLLYKYQE